jgi:ankyrin repeat protein
MKGRVFITLAAAVVLAGFAAPVPVHAQGSLTDSFSDGYNFLKAVRERDGDKATDLIVAPGSVVINHKDRSTGDAALHILARERDFNWLGFLIQKGARVDLQNKEGTTPLAIASQIGWLEGAERLLRGRATVDLANNRGETPLILAVQRRDINMVRLLLANGANPRKQDSVAGYSALEYAQRDGRSPAIVKLLEEGPTKPKAVAGPKL